MSSGRAVRIPARRPDPSHAAEPARATADAPTPSDSGVVPNRSGTMRAYRLFLFFVGSTLLLLLILILLVVTSPTSGVRDNPVDYGLFAAIGLVLIVASYALAMLPAPRAVVRSGEDILVIERTGRVRRLRSDPARLRPLVLRRYPAGPLQDGPVVLVEVALPSGSRRAYLVDEGLLGPATPSGAIGPTPR